MSKMDIYYKELRECLEKRSVDELMSFIERWTKRGVLDRKFEQFFKLANNDVKMMILCNLINECPLVTEETVAWANQTRRIKK